MKKVLITLMIALTVLTGVYAMDVTLAFEGKTNGFELNAAQEDKTTSLRMDAAVDAKTSFYAKNGVGGYFSVGYFYNNATQILPDPLPSVTKSVHGISSGLGFAFRKNISRNWDFVLGTGFGVSYGITSERLGMTYDASLNLNYRLGSKAYIDLGIGYELDFLSAAKNPVTDELESTTHVHHRVSVPTIGFGINF